MNSQKKSISLQFQEIVDKSLSIQKSCSPIKKYFGFLFAGIPGFIVAFILNILFVKYFFLNKSLSYAIVLLIQISINFFFLRVLIFNNPNQIPVFVQFIQFISTIIIFRIFDWGLYTFLVEVFHWHYLSVQVFNVLFFSFAKYFFSLKIFEYKKE